MKDLLKFTLVLLVLLLVTGANADAVYVGDTRPAYISELTTSLTALGVFDPGNGEKDIIAAQAFIDAFGTDWCVISKTEDNSDSSLSWLPGDLGLTVAGGGNLTGGWSVDPGAWDNYAQGDILAVLKAGTVAAVYELDLYDNSGAPILGGTWDVDGSSWNRNGLSHMSLLAPCQVPVPGAGFLCGIGLLTAGWLHGRKKKMA